jgi:two-component sensor histidine kinase
VTAFAFTLLSGRDAPLTARHAVEETVGAGLGDTRRFQVDLLLTELVTNAVKHGAASANAPISVECAVNDGTIALEVTNNLGRPLQYEPGLPCELAEGGRGLALVDALSSRWGSRLEPGCTTVWCELDDELRPAIAA